MPLKLKQPALALKLVDVIRNGDIAQVYEVLEEDADPNFYIETLGCTPFHVACQITDSLQSADLVDLMLRYDADPNIQTENGSSCLHLLAKLGHCDTLDMLLTSTGDPFLINKAGETARDIAFKEGHYNTVKLLDYVQVQLANSAPAIDARDTAGDFSCYEPSVASSEIVHGGITPSSDDEERTPPSQDGACKYQNRRRSSMYVAEIQARIDRFFNDTRPSNRACCFDATSPDHPYFATFDSPDVDINAPCHVMADLPDRGVTRATFDYDTNVDFYAQRVAEYESRKKSTHNRDSQRRYPSNDGCYHDKNEDGGGAGQVCSGHHTGHGHSSTSDTYHTCSSDDHCNHGIDDSHADDNRLGTFRCGSDEDSELRNRYGEYCDNYRKRGSGYDRDRPDRIATLCGKNHPCARLPELRSPMKSPRKYFNNDQLRASEHGIADTRSPRNTPPIRNVPVDRAVGVPCVTRAKPLSEYRTPYTTERVLRNDSKVYVHESILHTPKRAEATVNARRKDPSCELVELPNGMRVRHAQETPGTVTKSRSVDPFFRALFESPDRRGNGEKFMSQQRERASPKSVKKSSSMMTSKAESRIQVARDARSVTDAVGSLKIQSPHCTENSPNHRSPRHKLPSNTMRASPSVACSSNNSPQNHLSSSPRRISHRDLASTSNRQSSYPSPSSSAVNIQRLHAENSAALPTLQSVPTGLRVDYKSPSTISNPASNDFDSTSRWDEVDTTPLVHTTSRQPLDVCNVARSSSSRMQNSSPFKKPFPLSSNDETRSKPTCSRQLPIYSDSPMDPTRDDMSENHSQCKKRHMSNSNKMATTSKSDSEFERTCFHTSHTRRSNSFSGGKSPRYEVESSLDDVSLYGFVSPTSPTSGDTRDNLLDDSIVNQTFLTSTMLNGSLSCTLGVDVSAISQQQDHAKISHGSKLLPTHGEIDHKRSSSASDASGRFYSARSHSTNSDTLNATLNDSLNDSVFSNISDNVGLKRTSCDSFGSRATLCSSKYSTPRGDFDDSVFSTVYRDVKGVNKTSQIYSPLPFKKPLGSSPASIPATTVKKTHQSPLIRQPLPNIALDVYNNSERAATIASIKSFFEKKATPVESVNRSRTIQKDIHSDCGCSPKTVRPFAKTTDEAIAGCRHSRGTPNIDETMENFPCPIDVDTPDFDSSVSLTSNSTCRAMDDSEQVYSHDGILLSESVNLQPGRDVKPRNMAETCGGTVQDYVDSCPNVAFCDKTGDQTCNELGAGNQNDDSLRYPTPDSIDIPPTLAHNPNAENNSNNNNRTDMLKRGSMDSVCSSIHRDPDSGAVLVEHLIQGSVDQWLSMDCSDDSQATVIYNWKSFKLTPTRADRSDATLTIPDDVKRLGDDELRAELSSLGVNIGPITQLTRRMLEQRLVKLRGQPVANQACSSPDKEYYSPELKAALSDADPLTDLADLEQNLIKGFDVIKKWRDGNLQGEADVLKIFVSAIFYVGKGSRARPLDHLYDAANAMKTPRKRPCEKISHILDIWKDKHGVVSLHIFQNVKAVEAYTREACMIDAIGLEQLTNIKKGNYYGVATTWPMKTKRRMGVYLVKKALKMFLLEGERPLVPEGIKNVYDNI